jgi:Helix-turn-helix domain of resolvase
MPAGRPTKYKPEFCDRVIELARDGASKAEIALDMNIAYSTFDVWQNDIPEFSEAVKAAERISQGWWEKKGRISTFGGVDGFNATSYIFNMKNRFKQDWREKVEQEVSGHIKQEHIVNDADAFTRSITSLATRAGANKNDGDANG